MINTYKKLLITCICLVSFPAVSQSQLISNIHGYTVQDGNLIEFRALQFDGDTIEKIYTEQDNLPYKTEANINHIDGKGRTSTYRA